MEEAMASAIRKLLYLALALLLPGFSFAIHPACLPPSRPLQS
jgi:uncharacterized membrane protein